MNADHDRDRALDQALKAALGRGDDAPITPACLDAETLAAWMDGGARRAVGGDGRSARSNRARCQAMIGTLARATPEVAAREREPGAPVAMVACAAGGRSRRRHAVDGRPTDRYSAPPQRKRFKSRPNATGAGARRRSPCA